MGEGLVGQCAFEKKRILLADVPHDYVRVGSVLGSTKPLSIIVLPVLFEGQVKAVIELASIRQFSDTHLSFLDQLTEGIGIVFNTIEANMRTEDLPSIVQSLTTSCRASRKARRPRRLERMRKLKIRDLPRTAGGMKEQRGAAGKGRCFREMRSRYKKSESSCQGAPREVEQLGCLELQSEFLANMRTNWGRRSTACDLARMLSDTRRNLPPQIEYFRTIHAAGTDLLSHNAYSIPQRSSPGPSAHMRGTSGPARISRAHVRQVARQGLEFTSRSICE